IYFYQPAEDLLNKSKFNQDFTTPMLLHLTIGRSQDILVLFLEETNIKKEELLDAIKKIYEERKVEWNKYLDASGSGVMFYLREMTGLGLVHIGSSSYLPEQKKPAKIPHFQSNQLLVKEKRQMPFSNEIKTKLQSESIVIPPPKEIQIPITRDVSISL